MNLFHSQWESGLLLPLPRHHTEERLLLAFVHVVDDDASFRTAIERRLKYAGYEVMTYPSAQHLLDRLPSESVPGCILLDVQIPGLDGPTLQARLSELGSTLPIIFLTGHPDIATTVRTIKAGADDFLTKARNVRRSFSRNCTSPCTLPSIARPTEPTGRRSRPHRDIDAARAAGLQPCDSR